MALERKESKIDDKAFNPFYGKPEGISTPLKIDIDIFSVNAIKKGDSKDLNLFDDEMKTYSGQRYVMVGFINDGEIHVRAIPSFEFIKDDTQKKEFAAKAAKYFECSPDDIAFPDHPLWTGVVHQQLIAQVNKKEPKLVTEDTQFIAFSVIKNMDSYYWFNRSVYNTDTFIPDPLASAYYAFDKISDPDAKFDRFYHLTRSIPENFFRELTKILTIKLGDLSITRSVLDGCTNFSFEAKWEKMRDLRKNEPEKTNKKIQRRLMKNLHFYLNGQGATLNKEKTEGVLLQGFSAANRHEISIDIDSIPPECKGEQRAIDKADKLKNKTVLDFLINFKINNLYKLFIAAAKDGKVSYAKSLATNCLDVPLEKLFDYTLSRVAIEGTLAGVSILYDMAKTEDEKQRMWHKVCDCFKDNIEGGAFYISRKIMQYLTANIPMSVIQDYFKSKLAGPSLTFALHSCVVLAEKKLDINKKNAEGYTLLHLVMQLEMTIKFGICHTLVLNDADPNITNKEGDSALFLAVKKHDWFAVMAFIQKNKIAAENATKFFEYGLENNDFEIVIALLEFTSKSLEDGFDIDQQKMMEKFLVFFEKITDKDNKIKITGAILKRKSVIGRKLLKTEYESRFFDTTRVERFLEKLAAITACEKVSGMLIKTVSSKR